MTSTMTSSAIRTSSTANVMLFIVFQLLLVLVERTVSYSSGPPVGIPGFCSTMYPQHVSYTTQTSVAPFTITVKGPNGAACYVPGTPINVTLAAVGNETTFAGFFMEARQGLTVNASYGTFNSAGNTYVSAYDCFGQTNNAIGHNQDYDSVTSTFTWTAPTGFSGNVTFLATVVEELDEFWVQGVKLDVAPCSGLSTATPVVTTTRSGSSIITVGLSSATVVMATFISLWHLRK